MAIKRLEIRGYRSIDDMKLEAEQITAFIGANGSGKSNILSALNLFYTSLTTEQREENIFDANNPLRNEVCIRITYGIILLSRYQFNNYPTHPARQTSRVFPCPFGKTQSCSDVRPGQ